MRAKWLVGMAIAVLNTGCVAVVKGDRGTDFGPDAITVQEMRDRLQIEELLWRYARTLDSNDADGYAAVYTEDGQFGTGEHATRGRPALREMILGVKKRREDRIAAGEKATGTLHMTANFWIDFRDHDHATVHSYWITMFPGAGADTPSRVAAVGRAEDQLVRVQGRWLIKVRNVSPQD